MLIGVDWGGTKIEGVGLSSEGAVLARERIATPKGDYEGCIAAIAGLVGRIEAAAGRRGSVGVGIPGAISPRTGLIMNANSTWNIGRRLDRDLADALAREVRVENDANCFAVSEAVDGAGAGASVVWGVILGTGAGSGIAIGGRAIGGRNRIAGEWGHNPLPWPDAVEDAAAATALACYCGQRGCIETWLSGPALARDHGLPGISARQLAQDAAAGDAVAIGTLQRHAGRLAKALAAVINLLDPDVVVLGGGLSQMPHLYEAVPAIWGRWVFGAGAAGGVRTRLLRSVHGDASGVRGAAWIGRAAGLVL